MVKEWENCPSARPFRSGTTKGSRLRSMTRWSQFMAMAVAQLAGRSSLRDVVSDLSAQGRKLYHLGVGAVARLSLARVNLEPPHELYEVLFERRSLVELLNPRADPSGRVGRQLQLAFR